MSFDQNTSGDRWLAKAIDHYREARAVLAQWDEGQRRDRSLYELSAAEVQAGILAATIADAKFNESLTVPVSISSAPSPMPDGWPDIPD